MTKSVILLICATRQLHSSAGFAFLAGVSSLDSSPAFTRTPIVSAGDFSLERALIGLYSLTAVLCVIIDQIFINPFRRKRR
jgi:hypothetical protein